MHDARRASPLLHPFDDPVFAALATAAGIVREDLPEEYDPGLEWGNDSITTDLDGMTTFSFLAGDDGYHGRLRLDLHPRDEIAYVNEGGGVRVGVPMRFPATLAATIIGGPLSRVVAMEHLADAVVTDVQPDDDGGSWLAIETGGR